MGGYDCIVLDAIEQNEECSPTTTKYELLMSPQDDGSFTLECSDSIADDWCKRKVCMVDLRYLVKQSHLNDTGIKPNYENFGHPGYRDNEGSFNTETCAPEKS